jgi:membrane protein
MSFCCTASLYSPGRQLTVVTRHPGTGRIVRGTNAKGMRCGLAQWARTQQHSSPSLPASPRGRRRHFFGPRLPMRDSDVRHTTGACLSAPACRSRQPTALGQGAPDEFRANELNSFYGRSSSGRGYSVEGSPNSAHAADPPEALHEGPKRGSSNVDRGRSAERGHGRHAEEPHHIPARGWWDILLRVKNEMSKDHISVLAAGVGFYALLAIFPALAAAVSIYGLIADPHHVEQQAALAIGLIPEESRAIITDQLAKITSQPRGGLGFSAVFALLFAVWSSSAAMQTIMTGLNVVYDEEEKRGIVNFYATALALTLGGIVGALVSLSLVAALPAALKLLGLPQQVETILLLARWPILGLAVMFGLAVLYRFGPSREKPRWQWVSWGAAGATLLWLLGSSLFSWYVSSFGSYNETYGTLGAVVILLLWFYLSAYVVLLGAEWNAEMEHQTAKDTTERRGAPLGARGAQVADTVGAAP